MQTTVRVWDVPTSNVTRKCRPLKDIKKNKGREKEKKEKGFLIKKNGGFGASQAPILKTSHFKILNSFIRLFFNFK